MQLNEQTIMRIKKIINKNYENLDDFDDESHVDGSFCENENMGLTYNFGKPKSQKQE